MNEGQSKLLGEFQEGTFEGEHRGHGKGTFCLLEGECRGVAVLGGAKRLNVDLEGIVVKRKRLKERHAVSHVVCVDLLADMEGLSVDLTHDDAEKVALHHLNRRHGV